MTWLKNMDGYMTNIDKYQHLSFIYIQDAKLEKVLFYKFYLENENTEFTLGYLSIKNYEAEEVIENMTKSVQYYLHNLSYLVMQYLIEINEIEYTDEPSNYEKLIKYSKDQVDKGRFQETLEF